MTAEPEYPIISTADLKIGQTFRYGPKHTWLAARHSHTTEYAVWVEAKPLKVQPFQVGSRVRCKDKDWWPDQHHRSTATVKYVGETWLIVQVDDGDYEDAWAILHTEHIDPLADHLADQ